MSGLEEALWARRCEPSCAGPALYLTIARKMPPQHLVPNCNLEVGRHGNLCVDYGMLSGNPVGLPVDVKMGQAVTLGDLETMVRNMALQGGHLAPMSQVVRALWNKRASIWTAPRASHYLVMPVTQLLRRRQMF